jgi:hypothetical protein
VSLKKIILSILTVLYMTVSSGIAMEVHYCMGEKVGTDFYSDRDDKCGRCGMKEQSKGGCCHDDHQFVKLEDSHKKAANDFSFAIPEAILQNNYPVLAWSLPLQNGQPIIHNNSPPDYLPPPARILHGVFRI